MNKTDALLRGIGSILDISGASVQTSQSTGSYKTDSNKLSEDWIKVGNDIRKADKKYVRR